MKVLYVIGSLEVGGAEKQLVNLMIGLKNQNITPEVLIFSEKKGLSSVVENNGIKIHSPYQYKLTKFILDKIKIKNIKRFVVLMISVFMLLRVNWKIRPDVVHSFLPTAYIISGIVSYFSPKTAFVMSRRNLNNYQNKHKVLTYFEKILHKKIDIACGNSIAVIEDLKRENIPEQNIRLIYNGINCEIYDRVDQFALDQLKKNEEISEDSIILSIVANLIPYKGHFDLLRALGKIQNKIEKPWVLLCIGRDDGIKESLIEEAEKYNLSNHIKFLGSRADIPQLLNLSHIGIICSHEEGFSNSILEGMASGLPMVVTNVGGNAEAVLDGHTGFVVPSKCPNLLAEVIFKLIQSPSLRDRYGQNGKNRVQENFSMENCLDQYKKLYHELIYTESD